MKLTSIASAIAFLAMASIAGPSFAQGNNDTVGLYGGASVGPSRGEIDDPRIRASLVSNGFTVNSLTDDDRSTGGKLFAGYQFNEHFAIEGGVFTLGKFGYQALTAPAGTLTGEAKVRGLNLDLVGTLPITGNFSIFGRAGLTYAEARDKFRSTGAVTVNDPDPRERAGNWKAGLGLQYAFTPALSLRAEVERYRINDAVGNKGDINMASIGLVYRFGAAAASPPRAIAAAPVMAQAPEPIVMAPAPAPPPVPVPTPARAPVSEKVTFSSDALFDFDKSVLKPEGRTKLDELAARQKSMTLEAMVATGHTDSVGSDSYNDRLSMRRAEAVKAHFVSRGVEANRVYVEGRGEKQPIADNGTADGRAQNRRVQVEVVGSVMR
ncbi:MAG: OmpA family protein [Burkholderiaceae bacterium]